jgi:hypothetical protein
MQHTTQEERIHTLASIAAEHGSIKRTAQNWQAKAKADHGELGEVIGGTRKFNDTEKAILLSYAGEPKAKPEPTTTTPPAAAESVALAPVEVVPGNHRVSLDGPEIGGQIDLARFRGSLEVRSYSDPCHPANAAIQLLEAVESAMDADLENSFQQLEATAETVAKLEEKTRQLEAKSLEYRVTQGVLSRLQNQATGRLEALLGKAQALTGNEPRP